MSSKVTNVTNNFLMINNSGIHWDILDSLSLDKFPNLKFYKALTGITQIFIHTSMSIIMFEDMKVILLGLNDWYINGSIIFNHKLA